MHTQPHAWGDETALGSSDHSVPRGHSLTWLPSARMHKAGHVCDHVRSQTGGELPFQMGQLPADCEICSASHAFVYLFINCKSRYVLLPKCPRQRKFFKILQQKGSRYASRTAYPADGGKEPRCFSGPLPLNLLSPTSLLLPPHCPLPPLLKMPKIQFK